MERLQRIFSSVGGAGGAGAGPPGDTPQVDTSEQVYISSLALLKMLKHGAHTRCAPEAQRAERAGVGRGQALSRCAALKSVCVCRVVAPRVCAQGARVCRWR
jgi:hypothetical protein